MRLSSSLKSLLLISACAVEFCATARASAPEQTPAPVARRSDGRRYVLRIKRLTKWQHTKQAQQHPRRNASCKAGDDEPSRRREYSALHCSVRLPCARDGAVRDSPIDFLESRGTDAFPDSAWPARRSMKSSQPRPPPRSCRRRTPAATSTTRRCRFEVWLANRL